MSHDKPSQQPDASERVRERADKLLQLDPGDSPTVSTDVAQSIVGSLIAHQRELEQRAAVGTKDAWLLAEAVARLREGLLITNDHLDWPGPRIVFVNDAICQITGYSREELIGKTPRVLQGATTNRAPLDRLKTELSADRPCLVELTNYRKNGERYDAEVYITPLFDAEGRRTNFVSIHRDITKRTRAETAMRESEERFRNVFENAATGIAITDWDGRFERCNPAYCKLLGYSEQELREITFPKLVHPDDWPENAAKLHRLKSGEVKFFEVENRYVRKDGEWVWVHKFVSTLSDDTGNPAHTMALVTDITERRRSEQAVREREERLRAVLNTAGDAIITIDKHGVIAAVNPATTQMFGYNEGELVGRNVNVLMPSPYCEEHDGYIRNYRETGVAKIIGVGREVRARRKDGSIFPVDLAVSEIDHMQMFTGIVRDITERKVEQNRLLQAERLAGIGEAMAALVHESRNALARSQANLRRLGRRLEGQTELLELIEAAQNAQEDIARQFEEVRAYAAPLSLNFAPANLRTLVEDAWTQLSPDREGRNAVLRTIAPELDLKCELDRVAMTAAVRNVLENSLSACADPVVIDVEFSTTTINNRPALQITIRDDGPGLSPETARRAADAFFTTKTRGTGLGLAIVTRILEAHGGRFSIASSKADDGNGAIATLTVPKVQP